MTTKTKTKNQSKSQTPSKKQSDVTVETIGDEVHVRFGIRNYRVRGLEKNHSSQQLKVNVLAQRDDLVHLDTFDLYKARSRSSFIKATASELFTDNDIIKRDIGTMLFVSSRVKAASHSRVKSGH